MQSLSWKKIFVCETLKVTFSLYYLMTPTSFDTIIVVPLLPALAKKEQIVKNLLIHDNIVTLHVFVMSLILKHESLVNEHSRRHL